MSLKLWLISQDANDGYGTYDSAVVAAPDEAAAKRIGPSGLRWEGGKWLYAAGREATYHGWAPNPDLVRAVSVGVADDDIKDGEIICASFNAG